VLQCKRPVLAHRCHANAAPCPHSAEGDMWVLAQATRCGLRGRPEPTGASLITRHKLQTAKALDLEVPPTLLADEVIE
jgi:hypothetical protein